MKKMLMLGLLAVICWLPTAVRAEEPQKLNPEMSMETDGRPGKGEGKIKQIFEQLGLSDEQKKQLDANKEGHRGKMEKVWEQRKSYMDAMNQELMKSQLDMKKIKDIHEKFKADQAAAEDERLNAMLEVRKILTPEQYAKFVSLMQEMRQGKEKGGWRHDRD